MDTIGPGVALAISIPSIIIYDDQTIVTHSTVGVSPAAIVNVSAHVSLQRSETVSPWRKVVPLTCASVCHAVPGESPSLASFPLVAST